MDNVTNTPSGCGQNISSNVDKKSKNDKSNSGIDNVWSYENNFKDSSNIVISSSEKCSDDIVSPNKDFKSNTQNVRREDNPFSFKHFLSRDCNNTNKIKNKNTLENVLRKVENNSNKDSCKIQKNNMERIISTNVNTLSSHNQIPNCVDAVLEANLANTYQSSKGARPKVPQSISSSSSIGVNENSKMKRSPRFSSFDSQASLVECTLESTHNIQELVVCNCMSDSDLHDKTKNLEQPTEKTQLFVPNSEHNKKFIPRSYSNYDIDYVPVALNRFCNLDQFPNERRNNNNSSSQNEDYIASRPNRLIGTSSQLISKSSNSQRGLCSNASVNTFRQNSDFVAAALPDFVQDHWMDQWYCNEMHLNSSPNASNQSPIDFVEDLPCIATVEKCQTLPDFLSDGPIIHSSGRLADVASGLPDLDSPEYKSANSQISRINLENDRLRRELDESRLALSEQIRKTNDIEKKLEQSQSNELLLKKNLKENFRVKNENSEKNSNVNEKLKLRVKELLIENNTLRKENDILREKGAVGGRLFDNSKPSSNNQFSKEIMRAAANAEVNLRQLLRGVDNLRLLAKSLCDKCEESCDENEVNRSGPSLNTEASETNSNSSNKASSSLANEEYLSDCDDFDDLSRPNL